MKALIRKLDNIHDFTYMLILIATETAILVLLLAVYYIMNADSFANTIYYTSVARDLIISVRDMMIEAVIFAVIAEFVIRSCEK